MYYTYVLKQVGGRHYYVGSTNDLQRRLKEHKDNLNRSTRSRRWELYCYFAFRREDLARSFEEYLKGGSGRSFSKKHFEFKVDVA
jgi:predicted GIY-YIG superfamily endonuclease